MKFGKFNIVVDGQWGSCGKGLIAGYLAKKYEVDIASTNNLPNAGHTLVMDDDGKFISKILPVSTFLNKYDRNVEALIGPGAGFFVDRLQSEIKECFVDEEPQVTIHERAMVVSDKHAAMERSATKHIASTMQGSGAVQVERMMRGADVKLAGQIDELKRYVSNDWISDIHRMLPKSMWLHEGSQGFSLGMLHGSHYPYCTSRECTTAREMTDMGFAPQQIGDVYVVVRPYPIRVGNVVEGGKQVGYSGDVYPGQTELKWSEIKAWAGYPSDYDLHEMTTVTKRLRRVFTFSMDQVRRACMVNGATKLALNFANYLDYECFGTNGKLLRRLPIEVRKFIDRLEDEIGIPVALVGTGPKIDHVWELQ